MEQAERGGGVDGRAPRAHAAQLEDGDERYGRQDDRPPPAGGRRHGDAHGESEDHRHERLRGCDGSARHEVRASEREHEHARDDQHRRRNPTLHGRYSFASRSGRGARRDAPRPSSTAQAIRLVPRRTVAGVLEAGCGRNVPSVSCGVTTSQTSGRCWLAPRHHAQRASVGGRLLCRDPSVVGWRPARRDRSVFDRKGVHAHGVAAGAEARLRDVSPDPRTRRASRPDVAPKRPSSQDSSTSTPRDRDSASREVSTPG